jgi:hypothetical protein
VAVVFDVRLRSLRRMMGGVVHVGVSYMSMMGGFLMVPFRMMFCSFTVVFGGVVMMLGGLAVVFRRFL